MKEVRLHPQGRGRAGLKWLKGAAAIFALAIFVTAYPPSGSQSAPSPAAKTSMPGAGSPAYATPKELPSKGSPGAKLGVILFTEFH